MSLLVPFLVVGLCEGEALASCEITITDEMSPQDVANQFRSKQGVMPLQLVLISNDQVVAHWNAGDEYNRVEDYVVVSDTGKESNENS